MPGERHPDEQQHPASIFVCRFVPARNQRVRTTRLIGARDAEDALRRFATQLSPPDLPGWIDILDEHGALLRTSFHSG